MGMDINCDMGESFGNYKIGNDEAIMPTLPLVILPVDFMEVTHSILKIRLKMPLNMV